MVSSRQAIACILLSLIVALCAHAQTGAAKEQTASVSGKVTLKNKGVAGIVVVVAVGPDYSGGWQRQRYRATTDYEGNYRINDIPAGNYHVFPLAPALAIEKAQAKQVLSISAGESIRDLDFAMVRGGVITGRISNADGQPLVEESVSVMAVDVQSNYFQPNFSGVQTDDRGIYRAFGLRPGKYRVSVGQSGGGLPGHVRQTSRQTFYPSVNEIDKATVIEVAEGSEIVDIDIVAAAPHPTFTISGRIIDSAGKPVPGSSLGIHQREGSSSVSATRGAITNSNGQFKLLDVLPGKYTLFFAPPQNSNLRADSIPVEVIDRDITGLEFKTKKGASLSGMVVVDGAYDKSLAAMFNGLHVFAWYDNAPSDYEGSSRSVEVGADGSFKLIGMGPGNAHLTLSYTQGTDARQFEMLHIDHNGALQPSGISIREGEQVDGVRIVVRQLKLTGTIRGQVKIENGELLPLGARIVVWVNFADASTAPRTATPAPQVDSRGRFLLERLPPSTYEVRAGVFEPGGKPLRHEGPRQLITVADNAVTEVTLTIKLKP